MKKLTRIVVALLCTIGMTGVLSSCENDAPEINAQWTYITDWSKLVEAINNQSATMTIAIEGLGDDIAAKLDNNGNLIMNAIDQNGRTVSNAITNGFNGTTDVLGTWGNNIVLALDRNTAAVVHFDTQTQASFASLMQTIQTENGKLILAIGAVEGQTKAIALAIDAQGNVIKAAISDAATLLNNTLLAQNTLISTKADELKTELVNLNNGNNTALTNLMNQMRTSLAGIETATTTGFTNLTTKTEAGMDALGSKLSEIKEAITLGAANITNQMVTSTGTLAQGLDGIVTIIQTKGNAIADAIDRNTEATSNVGTELKFAISTFDANTQAKLKALTKQLKASGENIASVLTTLLDENSALVTVINDKGDAIAQGIVDVQTQLVALNDNITSLNQLVEAQTDAIVGSIDENTLAIGALDEELQSSLSDLKDEINTQGGEIVGGIAGLGESVDEMNYAIVGAIGENGVVLGQIADNIATVNETLTDRLKSISKHLSTQNQQFAAFADGLLSSIDDYAERFFATSDEFMAQLDGLFGEEGTVVAAIDDNGELIVTAIGANGTAISEAITAQGEAVVAEITNLKKVVKNQLEGINTTLQTNNDKLDLTNGNLSNIQSAIANNAQALTNIFNAVDDINDNLEEIAGALGAIDTEELVEAVGKIATNTEGVGTAVVGIQTDFDTLNGMLAQSGVPEGFAAIVEQLESLNDMALTLGTTSEDKVATLLAVLRNINTQLKNISDNMP